MKCQKIQRIVIATEETTWTAEIRTHLAKCPTCEEVHQRTTLTRNLIALKRYEIPDPEAQARCVDHVREQIDRLRQLEPESTPFLYVLPAPVYGIAAVCLILLGIHLAPTGTPSALDTVVTDTETRTFEQYIREGPQSGWTPYFVTMPTDELAIPPRPTFGDPFEPRPNSVFATNSYRVTP